MAIKGPKKFTTDELKELQELQDKINALTYQFGPLQISKVKWQEQEDFLKTQLNSLNQEESKVAKKLTDKYGKGSLNTETGEFIPVD